MYMTVNKALVRYRKKTTVILFSFLQDNTIRVVICILVHITISCEISRLFKFLTAKSELSEGLICIYKIVLYQLLLPIYFSSLVGNSIQCYIQKHCNTMTYFISSLVQLSMFSSPVCFLQWCTLGCVLTSYKNVSKEKPLKCIPFLWQGFSMRIGYEFVGTGLWDKLKVDVMFYPKSASLLTVGNSP